MQTFNPIFFIYIYGRNLPQIRTGQKQIAPALNFYTFFLKKFLNVEASEEVKIKKRRLRESCSEKSAPLISVKDYKVPGFIYYAIFSRRLPTAFFSFFILSTLSSSKCNLSLFRPFSFSIV